MTRDEMSINTEDLGDIFGTVEPAKKAPAKSPEKIDVPVEVKKTAPPAEEKAAAKIVVNKFAEMELAEKASRERKPEVKQEPAAVDNSADDLIKRAAEIEKEMKAAQDMAAPAGVPATAPKDIIEVLEGFDEIRRIMSAELTAVIDKKNVENMMLRTLEKSALAYPVLKNTNWSADGNLRVNGSIDNERMAKNIEACAMAHDEAARTVEEALTGLLFLRFKSVKAGLGRDKYADLSKKLSDKMKIIEGGYGAAAVSALKNRIFTTAVKRGGEEQ